MMTRRSVLAASGIAVLAADAKPVITKGGRARRKEAMKITRSNSQASRKGPLEYFTGSVRVDQPFQGSAPARVGGAFVTFEPGARTAWHTHPLGQTLIVTAGCGWVQTAAAPREEVHSGDIVWIPPGEKHWHGATATIGMTHIAIAEALDGKTVDWMEKVTDEEYSR
jgi:quercetin dioxygenase-like cupin family protein